MTTELAIAETHEIVITDEQTELIKKTICAEATDAEMRLFFYDCRRRGVHPLDKLIHFTKRGKPGQKKYVPITSIDFFRIRAHSTKEFDGEEEPVYVLGDDGLPDSCKYIVYRKGCSRPWHATARWSEYYPGDEVGFLWKKMPFVMLTKCAEALALRKAFPAELQGLYVHEEMDQAGTESKTLGKTFAEKFPEQAKAIEAKLAPRPAPPVDNAVTTGTPPDGSLQAHDAPEEPQSDPSEPYKAKLRTCERSVSGINGCWSNIPEPLKQDAYEEYTKQLRSLKTSKVK